MSLKKVFAILFGLAAVSVLGVTLLVALLLPRFVEAEVIKQAKQRGIELLPGEVAFGIGWLQLTDSEVRLIGAPAFRAKIGILDVELEGLEPKRFTLNQVKLDLVGDPSALLHEFDAWRRAHEASFPEPVFLKPLSVSLKRDAKSEPVLTLSDADLSLSQERARLNVGKLTVMKRELGAARVQRNKDDLDIALTLAQSSPENPVLALSFRGAEQQSLHVALAPVPLGRLGSVLQTQVSLPDVVLSGTFDFALPRVFTLQSHLTGRADFSLKGYVPPHPVELDGFVFGDTTQFSLSFNVAPAELGAALDPVKIKAGIFALQGSGRLALENCRPRVVLALSGKLPCNALAGAAAETRLGRALGRVTGKALRQTLNGSVHVKVGVDADPTAFDKARMLKTITPGCGLKPLTFAELKALGELGPEALDPAVLGDLGKLLDAPLPTLPNLGPDTKIDLSQLGKVPLPQLPSFDLPKSGSKPLANAPAAPQPSASAGR